MVSKSLCAILLIFLSTTFAFTSDTSVGNNLMCGPNCLWLAAKSLNVPTSLKKLRYFAETDPTRGTSLKGMLKALKQVELKPLLINIDWKGLNTIKHPAILLLNQLSNGHFIFLEEIDSKIIRVIDPPDRKTWTRKEFMNKFTGYAIVVCRDSEDKQRLEEKFKTEATANLVKRVLIFLTIIFSGGLIMLISRPWDTRKSMG